MTRPAPASPSSRSPKPAVPVRPTFLLIGAPKAGSTSLWHALRRHPGVFMPELKEPNFFCSDAADAGDWDAYHALFEAGRRAQAVGEASVAYSLVERNPETPARIARHLPGARILYIVRHPLRRMESAWLHHLVRRNPVPQDFDAAVRTFRPLTEGSLYMRNLDCYRAHFPDEQILVVFAEDFKAQPGDVLAACDAFLGVDPQARPAGTAARRNASSGKYVAPAFLHAVREALPGGQVLDRALPRRLKHAVKRLVGQPLPERPAWDAATRRHALDAVGEDARALLTYAGKPADFWDLAS